ncbi:hypothetical protein TrVGV298_007446 [Trichoderma virens]|nr:hypothetical protein TrVGV298_007446 [Trichoderma virens]
MATIEEALPNATSIPDDASEKARRRATYSSFGEDGLTATANAYGHLLQITQYFGNKPSGFVSVDIPTTTEPYFVSRRAHDLHRQSIDPTKGIRLLFEKADPTISHTDIWETDPPTLRSMSTPEFLEPPTPRPNEVTAPLPALQQESRPAPTVKFVHNRWPCFFTKTPEFDINIQYYIADKTVYQTYLFTLSPGSQIPSKIPNIVIDANLPLRDLDFVNQNQMNAYDPNSPNAFYSCGISKDGYCVVRVNTACGLDNYDRGDIALFMSPFVNGQHHKPLPSEEPNNFYVVPDNQALNHLREKKTLEITLAYTLQWVPSNYIESASTPVSEAALKRWKEKINQYPSKSVLFAANKHLDFALQRNLEHILSVCSIPISEGLDGKIPAIALTCGDISGHRVTGAASFYAFQFLISAFQFFKSQLEEECQCEAAHCTCKKYSKKMRKRILRVCWGHLKWIFNEANEDDNSSFHSWASGEAIDNWASGQSQSRRSLIDASFNIAKAADFCLKVATEKQKENVMDELRGVVSDWVENLHQNNQNNEYVFPHSTEDTPQKFQLADHAMIWRTLKSLEELGFNSELCTSDIRRGRHNIKYSSTKIQKSLFRHFTTKSTQLNIPMIATSRSLSETSFLLHIEDTATLYAMDEGLFDDPNQKDEPDDKPATAVTNELATESVEMSIGESAYKSEDGSVDFWDNKIDPWKATVDGQALHDDNDDATWDHPLQFALAMILSANNKCSNSRPANKMYKFARSVLLQSSSPNGLFPGQFDENREPILFSEDAMRDCYWDATFEIPYILWSYTGENLARNERSTTQYSSSSSFTAEMSYTSGYMHRIEPVIHNKDLKSDSMVSYEWLYKKPKFFGFRIDLSPNAINYFCENHQSNNSGKSTSETIDRAVEDHQNPNRGSRNLQDLGYIIDVSGVENIKSLSQRNFAYNILSPESIRLFIGGSRDSANAKKRLFHFYRADLDIALNCYLASSEQEEISSFFDKHSSYSKYFFEDTTTIFNKWVTELHLSFYQVVSDHASFRTIPLKETFEFPSSTKNKNTKRAGRAVMSFRFDGDLFDHYWTCHFFEHNPQWMTNSQAGGQRIDKLSISGTLETDPWQQRRILELLLFDMILQEMVRGTKGILKEIMTSVLKSPQLENDGDTDVPTTDFSDIDASVLLEALEVLSKVDSNTFASKNELWNKFQRILQVIEVDLTENLTMIDLWVNRENKIEINKLGWTARREQRFQGAISKLKLLNSHKIHELKRCRTNVASFNTLLTRRLEVMRNDLETRSNVDIRLFTYVTVVFLPISFATSVFSMSGAPTRETIGSMASTAGVALVITIVALINAKVLDAEIFRPLFQSIRPISEVTLRPILRNCRYAFRFFTGLIYLILLSLLSTLSGKQIHFLYHHLFSPLHLLVENALSEERDKRARESGGFFHNEIANKKKRIVKKRQEEATRLEAKKIRGMEEVKEENKSEKEERYSESRQRVKEINEEFKKPPQVEEEPAVEETSGSGSLDGTSRLSNEEADGGTPTSTIQKVKRWFKLGGFKGGWTECVVCRLH